MLKEVAEVWIRAVCASLRYEGYSSRAIEVADNVVIAYGKRFVTMPKNDKAVPSSE